MSIDTQSISERIFADPAKSKILYDFGISSEPDTAAQMVEMLCGALGQRPVAHPLTQHLSNRAVFRAAVRAIGSNSRSWVVWDAVGVGCINPGLPSGAHGGS